jgi:2-methylcitrate dehydratase PrpD
MIDGRYGYLRLIENDAFDVERIRPLIGTEWQIARLAHKPFPSGRLTHGVVDALMQLSTRHGFAREAVAAVTGYVPPLVHRLVGRPDIPEPEANYAKLCLAYVAGAWLARGRVDVPETADAQALRDPAIHREAAKVTLVLDDNPDPNALTPQRFEVRLRDGTVHEITLPEVYGHPDVPLDAAANEEKFRRCATHGRVPLPAPQADALVAAVARVQEMADVAQLSPMTVVPGARG